MKVPGANRSLLRGSRPVEAVANGIWEATGTLLAISRFGWVFGFLSSPFESRSPVEPLLSELRIETPWSRSSGT
jgi:hypothetical protein